MPATGSNTSTGSCETASPAASTGCSSPEGRVDPRLGDEKHVYGTAFVLYAASKAHEVTRRRTRPEGGARRLRLARSARPRRRARRLLRGDPPRRDADPAVGRGRPDRQADRPAGRLLRVQVDERAHPPPGGDRGVRPGGEDAAGGAAPAGDARHRPRPHRRRAGGLEPVPDARLAGDPGARLVRARHRDRLPARRGRRGARDSRRRGDLAHGAAAGGPRAGLGLGRGARRVLLQGRGVRGRGVRHGTRTGGRRRRG